MRWIAVVITAPVIALGFTVQILVGAFNCGREIAVMAFKDWI